MATSHIDTIREALNRWRAEMLPHGELLAHNVEQVDAALAYVDSLATPAGIALDAPDGPGFFAWEDGHGKGVSEVYRGFNNELIIDEEPGGLTANYFSGRTWTRLRMPWDSPTPAAQSSDVWEPIEYDHIFTPYAKPVHPDYANICEIWREFNEYSRNTADGYEYAICRKRPSAGEANDG